MRDKEISEGLGELADIAERDHEVQMARADLYKLAKYAIKLHDMLKGVSESEGLEGWVQSKITKSADMIGSVYHHMDYENSPMGEVTESKDTHCSDDCCGSDVKAEDCTCAPTCKSCNCNAVDESALQAHIGNKKYGKDGMDELRKVGREGGGEEAKGKVKDRILGKKKNYKESLQDKLSAKLSESENCSECGNPSYKSVSEEKKKGSHGKVCWKGYRRGEGNSCHRVKGDG